MLNFCPGCGGVVDQNQVGGQAVSCKHCGRVIGVATEGPRKVVFDRTDELIAGGSAGRCALCRQVVQLKSSGQTKSFVPHYAAGQRKLCPNSGKPAETASQGDQDTLPRSLSPGPFVSADSVPAQQPTRGKDLSKYYTTECIRVVACSRGQDATIEELSLKYLDKADRVRIQIEALREILGPSFRMNDYPPSLAKTYLALWSHADGCVVARKHPQGGYQPASDAELIEVVNDIRQHPHWFFL